MAGEFVYKGINLAKLTHSSRAFILFAMVKTIWRGSNYLFILVRCCHFPISVCHQPYTDAFSLIREAIKCLATLYQFPVEAFPYR